eukprot:3096173-Rhodomonas_salina.1
MCPSVAVSTTYCGSVCESGCGACAARAYTCSERDQSCSSSSTLPCCSSETCTQVCRACWSCGTDSTCRHCHSTVCPLPWPPAGT